MATTPQEYPKWVVPDPTWIMSLGPSAQQIPDYPPPLSINATMLYNQIYGYPHYCTLLNGMGNGAHAPFESDPANPYPNPTYPSVDGGNDSNGGTGAASTWMVVVQSAEEEQLVTQPRVPPLS
jgi:hypothetical protein